MDRAKKYLPQPLYPGSMQTASQNVCPGSNIGMHTAQPTCPVSMQNTFQPVYSTPMLNLPQLHPGSANKILVTIPPPTYTNTSATYINSEPGTSSSNFVKPRNIVISTKKLSAKQPLIEENFNEFNTSNDYYERFGQDLQASESEISQD
ncbi:unnamed protein product [Parnassius apollo]|uniref:(apollo) hypothetical protein n=1 Tax=Parnassius apollo TaxID=110799 RepID=A0A8S3XXN0_PARAO|nr:unnamed protein product [Parnassius apollo]